jgi:hypothetical protein
VAASYSLERVLCVPVTRTFDVTVAEDVLPKVLKRWGPVPAVIGTADLTGPWDVVGSERTVLLADGNRARETLLQWERPRHFRYRVDRFSGLIGRLCDHAIGEWFFFDDGPSSRFQWTYTFFGRGAAAEAALGVVVRTAWARYMEQCADLTMALSESVAAS